MKRLFPILTAFVCMTTTLHAQRVVIFLKNCSKLDSLSNVYFNMGDEQFLVIDAYKDGLIKNDSFQFRYKDGILLLNNKTIPEPFYTRYRNRLLDIAKREHVGPKDFSLIMGPSSSSGKVSVFAPEDEIKRYAENAQKQQSLFATTNMRDSLLINRLLHDGLIHTATNTRIRYNKFGIWINDVALYNSKARKYLPVFEHYTRIPAPDQPQSFAALYLDGSEIQRYGLQAGQ